MLSKLIQTMDKVKTKSNPHFNILELSIQASPLGIFHKWRCKSKFWFKCFWKWGFVTFMTYFMIKHYYIQWKRHDYSSGFHSTTSKLNFLLHFFHPQPRSGWQTHDKLPWPTPVLTFTYNITYPLSLPLIRWAAGQLLTATGTEGGMDEERRWSRPAGILRRLLSPPPAPPLRPQAPGGNYECVYWWKDNCALQVCV